MTKLAKNVTREWTLRIPARYGDGGIAEIIHYHIYIELDGESNARVLVNGQPDTLQQAAKLYRWAKDDGMATMISERHHTLTRKDARDLHAALGRLGVRSYAHYAVARTATGRAITSLTQVEYREVPYVLGMAAYQMGMPSRPAQASAQASASA